MKKKTYIASSLTIDETSGRVLFIYHNKKKKWVLPNSLTENPEESLDNIKKKIEIETGYEVTFFQGKSFPCEIQFPISQKRISTKKREIISLQYVTKVVGGIPVFHERQFAWFNIFEMVSHQVDVSIIQKARLFGCY